MYGHVHRNIIQMGATVYCKAHWSRSKVNGEALFETFIHQVVYRKPNTEKLLTKAQKNKQALS